MGTAMTFVIYFMIFSAVYAFGAYYMMKKKKAKATENFNIDDQKQYAEQFTREGLEKQHPYLKEGLKGKTIEAYTQCLEYKSIGQQAAKFAKQGAKSAVFKALGGSGRSFQENPIHCFLAISNTELHFFKYQTGEDVIHEVFTKEQVSKVEIKKMEKATIQTSAHFENYIDYLITINDGVKSHKFIVYQYFTEIGGDITSSFKDSYYKDLAKFEVIALHFKDTFQKVFGKTFHH